MFKFNDNRGGILQTTINREIKLSVTESVLGKQLNSRVSAFWALHRYFNIGILHGEITVKFD